VIFEQTAFWYRYIYLLRSQAPNWISSEGFPFIFLTRTAERSYIFLRHFCICLTHLVMNCQVHPWAEVSALTVPYPPTKGYVCLELTMQSNIYSSLSFVSFSLSLVLRSKYCSIFLSFAQWASTVKLCNSKICIYSKYLKDVSLQNIPHTYIRKFWAYEFRHQLFRTYLFLRFFFISILYDLKVFYGNLSVIKVRNLFTRCVQLMIRELCMDL